MKTLNILVVDDELGMRLGVERVLRKYQIQTEEQPISFRIDMAETGEAALELLAKKKPHIMVLDHKLPGIQGIEILDKLKKENSDILTIMVTAFASLEVAISATKSGAFDFLAKPFTPDELKHTIDKAANHLLLKWKAEKLAEEKKQIRFQFISVLAHELKSPLAAVEGYLRLMDKQMLGDQISGYEKMITRSMGRLEGMRKMIMDLLDLTRIESGKMNREVANHDMIAILRDSIENVTPDADERGIIINLTRKDPLSFNCDRGELEIIFNNFMTNAVKYNKDQGSVSINISEDDERVTVEFSDTGIGMDEESVQRLFGEFVRIKTEETKHITGSGLGLSIVKKLLGFYDGSVEVSSQPGEGSIFTIRLNKMEPACEQKDE